MADDHAMYTWRDWRDTTDIRWLSDIRERTSYAIQSQYSASARILALADNYQRHIDPHVDVNVFYEKMFDIYTAEGVGLDNWGRILQASRTVTDEDTGESVTLGDEYYRVLLLYKAMANISAATADSQNRLLGVLVGSGISDFPETAYVLHVDTMVIRYVFEGDLNAEQKAIFKAVGTLTRGAGVGWELLSGDVENIFGFNGQELQPFNQAPFISDDALYIRRS